MQTFIHASLCARRSRCAYVGLAAGILLLVVLGAAPAAMGRGTDDPARVIFDFAATPSWTHEYHGPGNVPDFAFDVVLASSSVAYVCGDTGSDAASDATLMKYVDGAPAWSTPRVYNSPENSYDAVYSLVLAPDKQSVYAAGATARTATLNDVLVVKWKSNGTRQWARRWDSSGGVDRPAGIDVDRNGNVYVAAVSMTASGYDWSLVSWKSSGAFRWAKRLNLPSGTFGIPRDIAVDGSNVYVTGFTQDGMMSNPRMRTVRYTTAGAIKWNRAYNATEGASANALALRPGGGVYVAGQRISSVTGGDGLVVSYTKSGTRDVFAVDTGPGGFTHQAYNDLAVMSNGMIVAVGMSQTAANQDCHQVAYTSDGTIAATATFPGAWNDEWVAVAADDFGGFYVTGTYHVAAGKTAIAVARGSVLNGGGGFTSLWQPALATQENRANAIAVYGTTAVVVGQCSTNAAYGTDQIVLGYVW